MRLATLAGRLTSLMQTSLIQNAGAWLVAALLSTACTSNDSVEPATYHGDIAVMVQKHCGSCHVEGNIAPFALSDYDTVSSLAPAMLAAIEDGSMPPWLAEETDTCQPSLPFKNDLRMSDEEKARFREWVDSGTPEGDSSRAVPLPTPPSLSIEAPSASLPFEAPFVVDGERDLFECFVLDPKNAEDVWITKAQLTPGNELVAHHGIVFVDFAADSERHVEEDGHFECFNPPSLDGYIVATWTPGAVPMVTPNRSGMPLPAGARIVVQMHYHPSFRGPESDLSSVELEWTTDEPEWEVVQALLGNFDELEDDGSGLQPGPRDPADGPAFMIPAGIADHVENMVYRQSVPFEFPVFSVGTHMHYVGTDMQIDLVHKLDKTESECLVHTPRWDFNWQRVYDYDAEIEDLPVIGPGDEIHMRCEYDNTMDNPFVAQAILEQSLAGPVDVRLGEETLDEMCIGLFGIVVPPGLVTELFAD